MLKSLAHYIHILKAGVHWPMPALTCPAASNYLASLPRPSGPVLHTDLPPRISKLLISRGSACYAECTSSSLKDVLFASKYETLILISSGSPVSIWTTLHGYTLQVITWQFYFTLKQSRLRWSDSVYPEESDLPRRKIRQQDVFANRGSQGIFLSRNLGYSPGARY